jgi:hypothetical protein
MNFSTTPKYTHSLCAPSGFKFDITKHNIIHVFLGHNNDIMFQHNNTEIVWEECGFDSYKELGEQFFKKHFDIFLIKVEN